MGYGGRSPPLRASRGTTAPQPPKSPPGPHLKAHQGKLHGSPGNRRAASQCRSPGEAPAHSYSSLRPPLLLPPPAPGSHLSSGSCRGSRPRGGGRAPPPPRSAAAPSAALPPAPGFIGGSGGRGKRRAEPLRGAPPPRAAPAAFPPPGRGERGVAPRGGERKGWGG